MTTNEMEKLKIENKELKELIERRRTRKNLNHRNYYNKTYKEIEGLDENALKKIELAKERRNQLARERYKKNKANKDEKYYKHIERVKKNYALKKNSISDNTA